MQLERESEKFFLEREREVDSVAFLLMGEKAEAKWQRKREREKLGKKIGVDFNDKVSDRKWHCEERERYWFFFFREREVGTEQWALVGFCFYWVFFFLWNKNQSHIQSCGLLRFGEISREGESFFLLA